MRSRPGEKEPTVLVKFISAGLAASVAEAATIPIDTAKVRLQVSVFIGQCFLVVDRLKTKVFVKVSKLSKEGLSSRLKLTTVLLRKVRHFKPILETFKLPALKQYKYPAF